MALSFIEDLLRPISGPVGIILRRTYYRRRLKRCGSHLRIGTGVHLDGAEHISFGNYVYLDKNVIITAGPLQFDESIKLRPNPACEARPGEVKIGDRCHIAVGCLIQGHGGVSIGNGFTASANVFVYSLSNSPYDNRDGQVAVPGYKVAKVASPVAIGDNVWLGLKSIVLGNSIGDHCFVKPFSLVNSDLPSNTVASGVPAIPERARFNDMEHQP